MCFKEILWINKICELKTLRGPHQKDLSDLSVSLCCAESLNAHGEQNCVQTHAHVGGASPVVGGRAVPPHLSLG